jgi:hypothetical protein
LIALQNTEVDVSTQWICDSPLYTYFPFVPTQSSPAHY